MSYNSDTIKSAARILELRREKSINETEKRRAEIYQKIPEYYELKKEMIFLMESYVSDLGNGANSIEALKEKLTENIKKREKLLLDNGYPKDYTDEKFSCEKCSDKGYVGSERCDCFKQLLIETAAKNSNLDAIMEEDNFSNFNFRIFSDKPTEDGISPRENMKHIISGVKKFIDGFSDNSTRSLLFTGKAGVGKTYLASCIAKKLIDEGNDVYYQTAGRITELIEEYRFRKGSYESNTSDIDRIYSTDLLIIDDLGTEFTNSYTVSILYELINKRLMNKKKMIITTNHSINDLNLVYTERLFSRFIGEFDLFEFIGEDLRIKNNI